MRYKYMESGHIYSICSIYTMAEIGKFFGVHYMTVSRAVRKLENR